MSESSIGLNLDGAGKKVRTLKRTVDGVEVHEEVHNVTDGAGNVVDPRKNVEVTGLVVVGASALPTGAAAQVTLAEVKAKTDNLDTPLSGVKSKTDNIDVALSTRALEAGGNLAAVKAKTDNLDVALSTRALEAGGNLAAIAGKDFATQTTLASILAQLDSKTGTLATQATLALILAQLDNKTGTLSTEATLAALSAKVTACNTGAVAGSLSQSTKHDSKAYVYAFGDITITGLLGLAKAAGKIIKIHFYSLQSTVDGVTAYFYEETSTTQLSKKWILNVREGQESPFVPAPANLPKCVTQDKDMGLNIAGGASPHVYWEVIYSVDDVS